MKFSKTLLVIPALSLLGATAVGAGACSASVAGPDWTADTAPNEGAVSSVDACAALTACCTADDAGDLYCNSDDLTGNCADSFQYELNYGYCGDYTYDGFTVTKVEEPGQAVAADDGGVLDDKGDGGAIGEDAGNGLDEPDGGTGLGEEDAGDGLGEGDAGSGLGNDDAGSGEEQGG